MNTGFKAPGEHLTKSLDELIADQRKKGGKQNHTQFIKKGI